jgi:hypothetical protein
MKGWYYKDGKPATDMLHIAKKLADPEYQQVRRTVLPNGRIISTVWVGIDYSLTQDKKLIFETMVVPALKDDSRLDVVRYSTEEEAINGHEVMVLKWQKRN